VETCGTVTDAAADGGRAGGTSAHQARGSLGTITMSDTDGTEDRWSVVVGIKGCRVRLHAEPSGIIYAETQQGGQTSGWSLRHRNRSRALQWAHGEVCRLLRREGQRLFELADRYELLMQVQGAFPDSELITHSDSAP